MRRAGMLVAVAAALGGCGDARLPPPAGPAGHARLADGRVARVDGRRREVVLGDQRVPAGVGPTDMAAIGQRLYVVDAVQGALLIFDTRPRLALRRRVYVPDRPVAIAVRDGRLRIRLAATHEILELTGNGAAKTIRRIPDA